MKTTCKAIGVLGLGMGLGADSAVASPDDGFDWAAIGDPGNVAYERDIFGDFFDGPVGAVDYTYRMSRTELTWGQYAEFVNAYSPYWTGHPNANGLTGGFEISTDDDGMTYQVYPGFENAPAEPAWGMAARYANWLHNGKRSEEWAFETGAYDMSDWVWSPNDPSKVQLGNFNHTPEARYWIPTEDEWVKAAYYDPNRYGEGQPGYWMHPNGSDDDTPSDQTTSSMFSDPPLPVGSFPDTQSPWGLLDVSGGVSEWLGDWQSDSSSSVFFARGSGTGDFLWQDFDRLIATPQLLTPGSSRAGVRFASRVPAPSALWIGVVFGVGSLARPRRIP